MILKNIKLFSFLVYITIVHNALPVFSVGGKSKTKYVSQQSASLLPGSEVVQVNLDEMKMKGVSYGLSITYKIYLICQERIRLVYCKQVIKEKQKSEEYDESKEAFDNYLDSFLNKTQSSFSNQETKDAEDYYMALRINANYLTGKNAPPSPLYFCEGKQTISTSEDCYAALLKLNIKETMTAFEALDELYLTYEQENWSTLKHFKMTDKEFEKFIKTINIKTLPNAYLIIQFQIIKQFLEDYKRCLNSIYKKNLITISGFCSERVGYNPDENEGGSGTTQLKQKQKKTVH